MVFDSIDVSTGHIGIAVDNSKDVYYFKEVFCTESSPGYIFDMFSEYFMGAYSHYTLAKETMAYTFLESLNQNCIHGKVLPTDISLDFDNEDYKNSVIIECTLRCDYFYTNYFMPFNKPNPPYSQPASGVDVPNSEVICRLRFNKLYFLKELSALTDYYERWANQGGETQIVDVGRGMLCDIINKCVEKILYV